jgi:hypothetical protein
MRPIRNIKKCRPEQGEACAPQPFFFIKLHPQKSPMTHFRYTQKSLLRLVGPYLRSVFPYMDLLWHIYITCIYIYILYVYILFSFIYLCSNPKTDRRVENLEKWANLCHPAPSWKYCSIHYYVKYISGVLYLNWWNWNLTPAPADSPSFWVQCFRQERKSTSPGWNVAQRFHLRWDLGAGEFQHRQVTCGTWERWEKSQVLVLGAGIFTNIWPKHHPNVHTILYLNMCNR